MPFTFDINTILKQIETFLFTSLTSVLASEKTVITGYLETAKTRLTDLAKGSLSGELKGAEVVKALGEETTNLKDEMLSLGEIAGADLQQIANDAINIFTGFLMDALYAVK
jgi:hypothetical protein